MIDETEGKIEADEEVKVEITETDSPVEVVVNEDDKPNQEEVTPDEGIESLRKRLEDEKKARQEAERRAYEAQNEAQRAKKDVQESDYQTILSAIDATKRNSDLIKRAWAEAMQSGDFLKAADLQEVQSLNSSKLQVLENGKSAIEAKRSQPEQPAANDPVEAFASQLTPRSADWVRAHPEVVRDQRLYTAMVSAHNLAMTQGYVPDTDAYFHAVENFMGMRPKTQTVPTYRPDPVEEPAMSAAAKPVQKRSEAPVIAPTSRVASNSSGKPSVVRLNAEQKEAAEIMGMSYEDYAKNMLTLRKEGKMN
jgi:hypothetical protein